MSLLRPKMADDGNKNFYKGKIKLNLKLKN